MLPHPQKLKLHIFQIYSILFYLLFIYFRKQDQTNGRTFLWNIILHESQREEIRTIKERSSYEKKKK